MSEILNPLTQQPIADGELKQITDLANRQIVLEAEIENLETQVSRKKEELFNLSTIKLPDAMNLIGLQDFSLKNGAKVMIKPFYSGKISDENKNKAFAWLRAEGHDSIIKRVINVALGKGDDKIATMISKYLLSKKVVYEDKESVHPQTLKSFIKEQMTGGKPFPAPLFGAYAGKVTKIEAPKVVVPTT